ncbi:MAG: histidine phosphatase family protein [Pseudomonadota bacterium]
MIFLRHPRPLVASGLCYGRLDVEEGPRAGVEIATALARTPPVAHVLASPARRCRRLAERLAARDGAPLTVEPRLWELDFGAWEGRLWTEIDRRQSDPWAEDPWTQAPPGGERFADLYARTAAVLAEAAPGTALVTHAGVIRAARMILTGADFKTVFATPVPYAEPLSITADTARETPWPT